MDILLDTTIQIDRITGTKQRQKAIKDVLADRKVYSSTYVLGEYSILQSIVNKNIEAIIAKH